MKKPVVILMIIIVLMIVLIGYGNLIISGEIVRSKELLGRHYGIAEKMMQDANKKYVVTTENDFYPTISKVDSPWCGYKLLVVTGIRYEDCKKTDIVAALIPTKAYPFWCICDNMPPTIVMNPDLGVYEMNIGDVPLRLNWP